MKELKPLRMKENKRTSFSKTVEKDGVRKTIRVDKVENGYIVSIEKSDDNGYTERKFISKNNPFEKEEKEDPDENMMNHIKMGEYLDI